MLIAAAVLAALLAAPVSAEEGVTAGEIVVGACSPKSGPQKELGLSYTGGAAAYFAHVNEKGGVHGRKLKLIHQDDEYEPEKAVACFNALQEQKIFAFGFGVGTPTGLKYSQLAESRKVPFIGLSAGAPFMYSPENVYVFAGRASYEDEVRGQVEGLWEKAGVRKIAVLFQGDAFGAAGLEGVKKALKKYGADIVAQASYPRNTVEIDAAYAQVKAADPEAVITVALAKPAAAVLQKAQADGWRPIFGTVAGRDSLLVKEAGKAAEGVIVANAVPVLDRALPTIKLHDSLLAKHAPGAISGAASVQGFVEAMLLVEGIKRAGKTPTRDGLVKAMESIKDFDTGLGPDFRATYGPGDHRAFDKMELAVIRGGKAAPIKSWADLAPRN